MIDELCELFDLYKLAFFCELFVNVFIAGFTVVFCGDGKMDGAHDQGKLSLSINNYGDSQIL